MKKNKKVDEIQQDIKATNGEALISEIIARGTEEAQAIISEAEAEAEIAQKQILERAKKEAERIINDSKIAGESRLDQQETMFDLDKRQAFLVAKTEILDSIFDGVYEKLKSLDGKQLEEIVIKMIKKETYDGDEVIRCSKNDYSKYKKLVPKINKQLKTNFTLGEDCTSIDSGFMIIGEDYDLNFDFQELVDITRKNVEKELAERLFED